MYSGQSEKQIMEMVTKGGSLYDKYANKRRLLAFVYADIEKKRSSDIVKQFFSQIHYTSGVEIDFFWIGYRSEREFSLEDINLLLKADEISISKSSNSIPSYFESEVFHRHNNFYLTHNKWNDELGNSSFYMVFYELFDGIPNIDNVYVVNFIRDSQTQDEEFMNEFVNQLRSSIANYEVDMRMIEKFLSERIIKQFKNRVYKVIKKSALLSLTRY